MIAVLRAIFWIAVVAAFVPAGFSAAPDGPFAREASALFSSPTVQTASVATRDRTSEFCAEQAEACEVGSQFARYAGFVTQFAAARAETLLEARLETEPAAADPVALDALMAEMAQSSAARNIQ